MTKDRECPCAVDAGVKVDLASMRAALKNISSRPAGVTAAAIRRSISKITLTFDGKACAPCPDKDALNQVRA